jgi:hypothetical protein
MGSRDEAWIGPERKITRSTSSTLCALAVLLKCAVMHVFARWGTKSTKWDFPKDSTTALLVHPGHLAVTVTFELSLWCSVSSSVAASQLMLLSETMPKMEAVLIGLSCGIGTVVMSFLAQNYFKQAKRAKKAKAVQSLGNQHSDREQRGGARSRARLVAWCVISPLIRGQTGANNLVVQAQRLSSRRFLATPWSLRAGRCPVAGIIEQRLLVSHSASMLTPRHGRS